MAVLGHDQNCTKTTEISHEVRQITIKKYKSIKNILCFMWFPMFNMCMVTKRFLNF